MFPWLWIFAPQVRWPLSGGVAQDLSTEAFFQGIRPGAGVPAIEKQAFEQASYGKQLGWLTDVLLDAIRADALPSAAAREAFANLRALRDKIDRIKDQHRGDRVEAAIALLDRIQADDPDTLRRLLQRYPRAGA
jgi:hypothetical protein